MNSLDKVMKARRKQRYKYIKKIFKARDMARQYLKKPLKVSAIVDYYSIGDLEFLSASKVAILIVDSELRIRMRAEAPKSKPVKPKRPLPSLK